MSTSSPSRTLLAWLVTAWTALLVACEWGQYPWQVRVPITDVGAQFLIADATWFEEEQTLFVFYRVDSIQGLSAASQIELAFRTDEVDQDFSPIDTFPAVHIHLPASCGPRTICGSYSTAVERAPRDVRLRLRYHRDGELFLDAPLAYHMVATGRPHESRSAVVYGVFNEVNTRAQWRLRHLFPAIRNEEAQHLGLRRTFRVEDVTYGRLDFAREFLADNPYGYGVVDVCPAGFSPHANAVIETSARAVFDEAELPIASSDAPHLCATSVVTDAVGEFRRVALGQKNPETRPAFPSLQTPVTENTNVPFLLEICDEATPDGHREMQMQRLFLEESDVVCIDDHAALDFAARLAARMTAEIDAVRTRGRDMVLKIAISRPDVPEIAMRVEEALALVVPPESSQSTPRVSGAFVFDSAAYTIQSPAVAGLVLWCPSGVGGTDLDSIPDTSQRSCAVQPVQQLALGEVTLSSLPILPTAKQYETFVDRYGAHQTGSMKEISFRAPTRIPASDNVPVGDFGLATFFNEEAITPEPDDAFSYCADEDTGIVVFRVPGFPDVLPLVVLGELHAEFGLPRYELGLFWDFPFLTHMKYESHLATATDVPVIDFTIGFGIGTPAEQYLGGMQWEQASFNVGGALAQCTRFCDHPTFDSSMVYNIDDLFVSAYASRCYRPRFPDVGDDGFPPDP